MTGRPPAHRVRGGGVSGGSAHRATAPSPGRSLGEVDPVSALRRTAFLLERELAEPYRVKACRRAARRLASLPAAELGRRVGGGSLTELPDVGPKSASVAVQAAGGEAPGCLAELDVAVEINSRPEWRDPPRRLHALAVETGWTRASGP